MHQETVNTIRNFKTKTFTTKDISDIISNVPYKTLYSRLKAIEKQGYISKNNGHWIIDKRKLPTKPIKRRKKNKPNTVEIVPRYTQFDNWKSEEFKKVGFILQEVKVSAVGGSMNSRKKQQYVKQPEQAYSNSGGTKIFRTNNWEFRQSYKLNPIYIPGQDFNWIRDSMTSNHPWITFKMEQIILKEKNAPKRIIVIEKTNTGNRSTRMVVTKIDDLASSEFEILELMKILGDLFYSQCHIPKLVKNNKPECDSDLKTAEQENKMLIEMDDNPELEN